MKKKDNRLLCYIGLVVLIILLLLPPLLRIFGKKMYVKDEKKKDEIIVLSCNKQDESISSTFLNNQPQNIDYLIKGDYSIKINEESNDTKEDDANDKNIMVGLIKQFAVIEYDESNDSTRFKTATNDLKELKEYQTIFSTLENQQNYYQLQGFHCEKVTY